MSTYSQQRYHSNNHIAKAAEPAPIITVDNGQWACSECTFLNDANKQKCDMCLTPKPEPPSIHSQSFSNHASPLSNNNQSNDNSNYRFLNKPPSKRQLPNILSDKDKEELGRNPNKCIIPKNISFNPSKSINKQSIFERWMISQIEMHSGQQPSICVKNNVLLANLHRIRAPTTFYSLQQQINENTHAMTHANNLDAGDFTDDEFEEDEYNMNGASPRSPSSTNGNYGFSTPSSTTNEYYEDESYLHSRYQKNASSKRVKFGKQNAKHSESQSNDSFDQSQSQNDNKNNRFHRTYSSEDAYDHKRKLNHRRRPKAKHFKNQTVKSLWFRAQFQLKQGRNPGILSKYNITLTNIRQHHPRFQDHQRRKSHHDKAATYLAVTGDRMHTNKRAQIDNDDDDGFSDDPDNDVGYSSTSGYIE